MRLLLWQNILSALEQLWTNKVRSLLTVLGIIIAVTSTLVVVAAIQGFSNYVTNFLQGLGTNSIWVVPELPRGMYLSVRPKVELVLGDIEEVEKACPSVSMLAPLVVRQAKMKYENTTLTAELTGTGTAYQNIRNRFVELGRFFGPVDIESRKRVCLVGRDVLRQLGADDGIIGRTIVVDKTRLTVIGIMEKKGNFFGDSQDNYVLIPYTTAIDLYPEVRKRLAFMCQTEKPDEVNEAKAQIINVLRRRHKLGLDQPNDFRINSQDEILKEFGAISAIATSVLAGIVSISLLVGGIGIMNVMLVSVTERTREIGLRKAVGARRRDILFQFLTEAIVLSLAGGFLGIGLGYFIVNLVALNPSFVSVSIPVWAVMIAVGFSASVGVVFGLLPAMKAAILQPIDALRHE